MQIAFLVYTGQVDEVVISALLSSVLGTLITVVTLCVKARQTSSDIKARLEVTAENDKAKVVEKCNLTGKLTKKLSRWMGISRSFLEIPFVTARSHGFIIPLVLDSENSLVKYSQLFWLAVR